MSSTIEFSAKNYEADVKRFVTAVEAAERKGSMSIEEARELDALLNALAGKRRQLKTETRLLTSRDKAMWNGKIDDFDVPLKEKKPTFERLKQNAEKSSLLPKGAARRRGEDDEFAGGKTNDEVLANATDIQDKTDAAGRRILNTLADANAVAEETDAELQRQGEQLRDVRDEVQRIDSLLDFAQHLVSTVSKRIYTDRILMCFALINIILIISAIAYLATQENGLSSNDEEPEPSEPSG